VADGVFLAKAVADETLIYDYNATHGVDVILGQESSPKQGQAQSVKVTLGTEN
jgi:hypothetical protein